ncbi:FAD-dependent monooxygenase [Chloroflexota bacterium]
MTSYDVIVVGAGPAGVASALKCVQKGYNTLLMERDQLGRHKPCGGVTPTICADLLEDEFGLELPSDVMCSPNTLGLFYVPPSGRVNGGHLKNYRLLNLNRDLFDQWLCQTAEGSGVKILHGVQFLEFYKSSGWIKVIVKEKGITIELKTRYLIGADGVFSKVREQLYTGLKAETMIILQEYWKAKDEFDEFFYVFLNGDITPSYAYLIPKNGLFIIGTGVPQGHPISVATCLNKFRELLCQQFDFKPVSLENKEAGAIPYHSLFNGRGNVILVGDAAGFCNSFSGEGIRLAIESGTAASEAITQAEQSSGRLSSSYAQQVNGLSDFIRKTYKFSITLQDTEREQFVATQLKRL